MTIIAIRDGIMAVDSMIGSDGLIEGEFIKFMPAPSSMNGGFIAGAGSASSTQAFMEAITRGQKPEKLDGEVLHMDQFGKVSFYSEERPITWKAPFYVSGSGREIALGAMAAGASAVEAAEFACKYSSTCAGPVHVLRCDGKIEHTRKGK